MQENDEFNVTREIKDDSRIVNKSVAVRLTKVRTRGKNGKVVKEEADL